uniref:Uncharacterized protein n=1 Tax=uncultured marine virus TaxID=186617 RepID=A0A0F7L2U1_9VIRU|nr:hypothetical protein [uncultured marine virus]
MGSPFLSIQARLGRYLRLHALCRWVLVCQLVKLSSALALLGGQSVWLVVFSYCLR